MYRTSLTRRRTLSSSSVCLLTSGELSNFSATHRPVALPIMHASMYRADTFRTRKHRSVCTRHCLNSNLYHQSSFAHHLRGRNVSWLSNRVNVIRFSSSKNKLTHHPSCSEPSKTSVKVRTVLMYNSTWMGSILSGFGNREVVALKCSACG